MGGGIDSGWGGGTDLGWGRGLKVSLCSSKVFKCQIFAIHTLITYMSSQILKMSTDTKQERIMLNRGKFLLVNIWPVSMCTHYKS